jgi:hypothetical protein
MQQVHIDATTLLHFGLEFTLHTLLLPAPAACLTNRRLRNSLKNMYQLHFSREKVQLHFSVRKVQLVAVASFLKLQLHFSEMTEK